MIPTYIQLHAPEPPRRPLRDREEEERERNNPYPDYEQSYIIERDDEPENNHVITIDI